MAATSGQRPCPNTAARSITFRWRSAFPNGASTKEVALCIQLGDETVWRLKRSGEMTDERREETIPRFRLNALDDRAEGVRFYQRWQCS